MLFYTTEEHLANVATYNKNKPEQYIEISKIPEQLKNDDRNMPDTRKIIKS